MAGCNIINQQLVNIPLPDALLNTSVPTLGETELNITEIILTSVHVDPLNSSVTLLNDEFFILFGNLTVQVDFHFQLHQLHFPHIKSHGQARVVGRNGNISALADFNVVDDGTINLKVAGATADFHDIKITISDSKLAFLYNALGTVFQNQIKARICNAAANGLLVNVPNEANKLFSTMPRSVEILELELNTSFVAPIQVNPQYALAQAYGLFQSPSGHFEECPLATTNQFVQSDKMVSLSAQESIANCFTWSLFVKDKLVKRNLDKRNVAGFPPELANSSTWANFVPSIETAFPNHECSLDLVAAKNPTTKFTQDGIMTSAIVQLSLFVFEEKRETILSVSINIELGLATNILDKPEKLLALGIELVQLDVEAQLLWSHEKLGKLDMDRFNLVLKAALGSQSETIEKFIADQQFSIPAIEWLQLRNTSIQTRDGLLQFDTDALYI